MVVSPPRADRLAVARERAAASRKPAAGTPAYLRHVNRPAGAVVARYAFVGGRTPNQLTAAGAVVAGLGLAAVLVSVRWPWASTLGGALLLGAYVLDSADGQLARLRGGGSAAGEWLDHVVDVAKSSAVHAVAVVVVLTHGPTLPAGWGAVPLVAGAVSATGFFAFVLRDQLLRGRPAGPSVPLGGRWHAVGTLLHDHALVCLVLATAGWAQLFIAVYTAHTVASAAVLTRALRRAYRDLHRSASPPPDRCTRSQS